MQRKKKHSPWKKALQPIKKRQATEKKAQKSTTVLLKALATIPAYTVDLSPYKLHLLSRRK